MVSCFKCNYEATHYTSVIYAMDARWADEGTNHGDDYTCVDHITTYIASFTGQPGVDILEITVQKLGGLK